MQNCWIVMKCYENLPIFSSDMYIRVLWVISCPQSSPLCYLNSNAQPTQDEMQKSPHFYTMRQNKHKDTIQSHVNTLLLLSEQCTDNGQHHLQLAAAQVPLQCAPLSCSDTTDRMIKPVCFTCFIKNTSSSSHKKINNDLFALEGLISKMKIWKLAMIRSLLPLQVVRCHSMNW